MNFISYANKVYVTDGFTRRHIATTAELNQLHAAAGKPPITPVTKATFDNLVEFVAPTVLVNEVRNVGALVVNFQRVFVDWTYTQG